MSVNLTKETYVLAPAAVIKKARRLANIGSYEQALNLLQKNSIEYIVHPYGITAKVPNLNKRKK